MCVPGASRICPTDVLGFQDFETLPSFHTEFAAWQIVSGRRLSQTKSFVPAVALRPQIIMLSIILTGWAEKNENAR